MQNSLVIGSKLDTDIHLNQCRIAFHGNVLHMFTNKDFKDITQPVTQAAKRIEGSNIIKLSANLKFRYLLIIYLEKLKVFINNIDIG